MSNPRHPMISAILQLAGGAALLAGAVLSLRHLPIAIAFLGGAAAFYIGRKLSGGPGAGRAA